MTDQKPYQFPPDDFTDEELAAYEAEQVEDAMPDSQVMPDEVMNDNNNENAGA